MINEIEDFIKVKTIDGKSQNTTINYKSDLRILEAYCESKQIGLSNMTQNDFNEFKDYLMTQHLTSEGKLFSTSSINRIIITIKEFYKYMVYIKAVVQNPTLDLRCNKLPKRLPKYFTLKEVKRLLQSLEETGHERDTAIIQLFLSVGLRLSEMANLKVKDIHGNQLRVIGKGNKERVVALNNTVLTSINEYMKTRKDSTCEALFLSSRDRGISLSSIKLLVKQSLTTSGIPIMSVHKLRHTAATLMLEAGVDIRIIQEILGHENIATTTIYAHVNDSQKNVASKKSEELMFGGKK